MKEVVERNPEGKLQIMKEVINVIKRDYNGVIGVQLRKGMVRNLDIFNDNISKRVVHASKKKTQKFPYNPRRFIEIDAIVDNLSLYAVLYKCFLNTKY